jgi:hypothetical protein
MKEKVEVFLPFAKVEENEDGTVYVEGVATAEVLDSQGEVVLHDAAKAAFAEWTQWAKDATGGLSMGNIREMHERKAAGKAVAVEVDDEARQTRLGALVVDPVACSKVRERVYAGFSIGGDQVKRSMVTVDGKAVPAVTHLRLTEVSLVDKPACPVAVFSLVKRDDAPEQADPDPDVVEKGAAEKDAVSAQARLEGAFTACREAMAELLSDDATASGCSHAVRCLGEMLGMIRGVSYELSYADVQLASEGRPVAQLEAKPQPTLEEYAAAALAELTKSLEPRFAELLAKVGEAKGGESRAEEAIQKAATAAESLKPLVDSLPSLVASVSGLVNKVNAMPAQYGRPVFKGEGPAPSAADVSSAIGAVIDALAKSMPESAVAEMRKAAAVAVMPQR